MNTDMNTVRLLGAAHLIIFVASILLLSNAGGFLVLWR